MIKTFVGVLAALGLAVGVSAFADQAKVKKASQERTFTGDIVNVDTKDHTFAVKGTEKGDSSQMTFKVDKNSQIYIDGQRSLLGQLQKDEAVTVTYKPMGSSNMAQHVQRRHKKTTP